MKAPDKDEEAGPTPLSCTTNPLFPIERKLNLIQKMGKSGLTIAASLIAVFVHAQSSYIRNVNVVDVKAGKTLANQTVMINNGKIESVAPAAKIKIPAGAKVVDGTGKFLMPGMTDAHIHFFQSGSIYTRPDAVDLQKRMPYEKEKEFAINNSGDYLRRYLRLGITSVIDVGGPMSNFIVRDSISKTTISPNVLVTGPLFSMVDRDDFGEDKPIVKITSPEEADALLQKILAQKPDFIKIWYIASPELPAEKNFSLVKYIADQTHKNGLKLTVHATELNTAKLAVEAGADILVHSVDDSIIPPDLIKKWKEKKITYIPTLIVAKNYGHVFSGKLPHHPQDLAWANAFAYGTLTDPESIPDNEMPPVLKALRRIGIPKQMLSMDTIMRINLRNLVSAGVNVAAGTDAGNIGTMHASSYLQELEAMQLAGLTNAEIIRSATLNPAIGFGRDQAWGSIEKGKMADLVLLNGNPMESLQHLNAIHTVFRNGESLSPDSLVVETPEQVVQRQLNAYNAHDLEAFIDTYSDDVELYDYPATLGSRGKESMRKSYGSFFKTTPNLYCEIQKRIVIGNKVIDHEKVRAGNQTFSAVAVYEVINGKINKVTFIR